MSPVAAVPGTCLRRSRTPALQKSNHANCMRSPVDISISKGNLSIPCRLARSFLRFARRAIYMRGACDLSLEERIIL